MIDIDKIEEAAKRHGSDADWQGAAIAYQTHVTPSDVLELVGLIRSQEVALKISHEKFDAEATRCKAMSDYAEQLKSEMAAIPAQTGVVSVTAAELSCVINWLEGGRDPKDAAKELRLYCERAWTGAQPVQQPAPVASTTERPALSISANIVNPHVGKNPVFPFDIIPNTVPVAAPVAMPDPLEQFLKDGGLHGLHSAPAKPSYQELLDTLQQVTTEREEARGQARNLREEVKKAMALVEAVEYLRAVEQRRQERRERLGLDHPIKLFQVWMSDMGQSCEWIGDDQFSGFVNQGKYEAFHAGFEIGQQTAAPQPDSGRDAALGELPPLPDPYGVIAVHADNDEGSQTHEVDGWAADQMRGYALDYGNLLAIRALAAHPANVAQLSELASTQRQVIELQSQLNAALLERSASPNVAQVGEEQIITQRDAFRDVADNLANAIAAHFGADIGEHSSANCPWTEALRVIEEAGQVGELSADVILGYAREVGILGPVSDGNALKYARLVLAAAKKGQAT